MKKLFAAVLALMLILASVSALADGVTFTTSYFTMELPEGWIIDNANLEKDPVEKTEELGHFGTPDDETGLIGRVDLIYYEDLKDIALWNADADDLKDYAESLMKDFEDDHPVYLDTIKAGSIPFVLIKAEDEDGEYLFAETMTNGYALQFVLSVVTPDGKVLPLTDEYIEQFKTILATFKPAA